MKIFTNKSIWKKIIIVLIIVLLFQFVATKPVHADVIESGGKLISPILSLLVGIGDGIMDLTGRLIMGNEGSNLYEIDRTTSILAKIATAIVCIAAAAVAILAIVATAGLAAMALAAVGITATVTVGVGTVVAGIGAGLLAATWFNDEVLPDNLYLPLYSYSAEEIFKGNILLFNVNFFEDEKVIHLKANDGTVIKWTTQKEKSYSLKNAELHGGIQYYFYYDEDGHEVITSNQDSAAILKNTVSSWYNGLRNICLVLMLSVLVYIGIRMLLSSTATDKSKYLTMLKDWFIGLCLLFLMHYIMAFSVTLVEKLTDVIKISVDENGYIVTMEADGKMKEAVDADHLNQPDAIQESNGTDYLNWPTNLMGYLRLQLQMEDYGANYVGLCLCFIILCLFTLYFTVTYLKRVLYMAFLTLVAPMVALTYCIDKLNDGQAQGFNKWFKEYIFNLLIQPMHLLLYYILITSAFELAGNNIIYSIVAIGFMIPAEKLLRSLFGFEKAHTPPALGPAGAMMASSALNHLLHKPSKGKGEGKNGASDEEDYNKIPMHSNANPVEAFLNNGDDQATTRTATPDLDWSPELNQDQIDELKAEGIAPGDQEYSQYLRQYGINSLVEPTETENQVRTVEPTETTEPIRAVNPTGTAEPVGTAEPIRTVEPTETTRSLKNGPKRRIKRMLHASWVAQKAAMRSTPRKLKRKIENSHPIRAVGKIAAGAALGTAAGAAGLAIAASTGDLSNVPKIGGGSAAAGFALGSGRAQSIESPMQDKAVKEVYNEAYSKGEYKQDAMDDYVKKYKDDVKIRNYFEQKFGAQEAKEMLKKGGEVEKYLYNEITDKKEMAAVHKLHKERVVKSIDEGIAVAQLGQMIGENTNNMTTKKRNEWKTRIGDMAGESGVKNKERFATNRLREIDKFNDFKK